MISWALKRGADKDAPNPDDTQIEQPDTPAPVFAVRAIKTALFGTPAPRTSATRPAAATTQQDTLSFDIKSPNKPPGILLTPGTGTSRRKRVSFGEGVKAGVVQGLDELPGDGPRPKTRLMEAMENARNNKGAETTTELADEWVDEYDEESEPDPDITVDLNEPHSRSGRYWKAHFEDYHKDAKTEMEKLVKYKQLAKSYAQQKDAEAVDLHQRLKEEQERVKAMEEIVHDMREQLSTKAKKNDGKYDPKLMDDLAKQSALAVRYKEHITELEGLIAKGDKKDDEELSRKASPRTHKTLLEAQRELRKARSQLRELDRVKSERERLKSELKFAEQRTAKLAEENRKLAAECSELRTQAISDPSTLTQELEKTKETLRARDKELMKLRNDYDDVKENAKMRYREAELVVRRKDIKIIELRGENTLLKKKMEGLQAEDKGNSDNVLAQPGRIAPSRDAETRQAARLRLEKDIERKNLLWDRATEKVAEPGENTTLDMNEALGKLRRKSIEKGLISPAPEVHETLRRERSRQELRRRSLPDPAQSVAVSKDRSPITGTPVLADRVNQQEPRRVSSASGLPNSAAADTLAQLSAQINSQSHKKSERIVSDSQARHSQRPAPRSRPVSFDSFMPEEPAKADLVRSTYKRLGAPAHEVDGNSTVLWDVNASKVDMPENRRQAAIARLQRKQAEKMLRHTDRNKENRQPHMA